MSGSEKIGKMGFLRFRASWPDRGEKPRGVVSKDEASFLCGEWAASFVSEHSMHKRPRKDEMSPHL
jgi:hypothetical protein